MTLNSEDKKTISQIRMDKASRFLEDAEDSLKTAATIIKEVEDLKKIIETGL